MDITQLRQMRPELANLDDETVVRAIQLQYPDVPTEKIAADLGIKLAGPPPEPRTIGGTLKDVGISALSGAVAVPEAAVGLADMVTGGAAGRGLASIGFRPGEAKQILHDNYSDPQRAAFRSVDEADGFMGKLGAAVTHPSTIAHSVIESLPVMGAGGVIGRAVTGAAMRASPLLAGRVAAAEAAPFVASPAALGTAEMLPAVGAAIGEGTAMAGSAAEQIRQSTPGGGLSGEQVGMAALTGVGGAAFAMLGAGIAKKLGIADVDTMLVAGRSNPIAAKHLVRQLLEGAFSEGVLEELPQSIMEQVLQNKALGKPLEEGVDQAAVMGLLAGAAMGGGAQLMSRKATPMAESANVTAPGADIHTPAGTAPVNPNAGPLERATAQATPGAAAPAADPAALGEGVKALIEAGAKSDAEYVKEQQAREQRRAEQQAQRDQEIYDEEMAGKPIKDIADYDDSDLPAETQAAIDATTPKVRHGVDEAAHQAATSPLNDLPEPTQAQKEAGNYKVGRLKVAGLDVSIENPQGSTRTGLRPDGTTWEHVMSNHYGYVRGSVGSDGEQVDVYVGPRHDAPNVYVIDQVNQADKSHDEHKAMIGFANRGAAVNAYKSNFDKGWVMGRVTEMPIEDFKTWLKTADLTKPASPKGPLNQGAKDASASTQAPADAGGQPVLGAAGENVFDNGTKRRPAGRANVATSDAAGSGSSGTAQPSTAEASAQLGVSEKAARDSFGAAFYGLTQEEADDLHALLERKYAKKGSLSRDDIPAEFGAKVDTAAWMVLKDGIAAHPQAFLGYLKSKAGNAGGTDAAAAKPQDVKAPAPAATGEAPAAGDTSAAPAAGAVEAAGVATSLDNFGWNVKKLSDAYSMERLNQLGAEVRAQHANPLVGGGPVEDGRATKERINAEGRPKMEALQKAIGIVYERNKKAAKPAETPKGKTLQERRKEGKAAKAADEPVVEHITGKGKTLTGYVRKISEAEAKAIDPGTFRVKNGGWFLRKNRADDYRQRTGGADAKQLEGDAGALQQPQAPGAQGLRGQGRDSVPAVGGLPGVPGGRGAATEPGAHAGSGEESSGVSAGQRPVGNAQGAAPQSDGQRGTGNGRAGNGAVGLGEGNGTDRNGNSLPTGAGVGSEGRPDSSGARGRPDTRGQDADAGRRNADDNPVGAQAGNGQGNAPGAGSGGLVGREGADNSGAAKGAVSANTIVTDDAAEKARAILRAKLGTLNSGMDPELLGAGITLTIYHIEKGARTFVAYAKAMVEDMGEMVRPYLKSWYMAAKYDPRSASIEGMDDEATVNKGVEAPIDTPKAAGTLIDHLAAEIAANRMPKDNPALKKLVEAFDGKPADGHRMKAAQEQLEAAIVMTARGIVDKNRAEGPKTTFAILRRLYDSQPLLNVRTSTSVDNQAYSTPAPLAYLTSELAGITHKTVTLEPTGGTGMLLIGANPKTTLVNELNPERAALLEAQGFSVTQMDAAIAQLAAPRSVDRVHTNPPFGSLKDEQGNTRKELVDGYKIGQIDHLIAARALEAMKDDGKAVLILGANKVAGGMNTDDRIFLNWLYSHYGVTAHFEVDGKLYTRQGAGWPVRVIAISGRVQSDAVAPREGTIQRADTWEKVYEQFENAVAAGRQPVGTGTPGAVGAGTSQAGTGNVPGAAGAKTPGAGGQGSAGGAARPGNVAGAGPGPVGDRGGVGPQGVGTENPAQRPDGGAAGQGGPVQAGQPAGARGPVAAGNPGDAASLAAPENQFQAPYEARSARKDEGVLIPVNMAQPLQEALDRLEDEVGDIDEFAAKELGYQDVAVMHEALMGLQVDSVAAAIHQIKAGKAIIIADQTGIGKGRQAAAIIRWAIKQGKVPVFVSAKDALFTDMFNDLHDIGSDDVRPYILNLGPGIKDAEGKSLFVTKPADRRNGLASMQAGEVPDGRNAVFMTYSQINAANTQRGAILGIAPNAVMILDESHNAGGDSATGDYIKSVLSMAQGTVYLSATYAKRPDNMPLYFKTDMGEAVADDDTLMDAMANGGLPLQTVVSNNLVKAGQMFRRERSYDGISIETVVDAPHRAEHEELSDKTTTALRAIVAADRMFHNVFVSNMNDEMSSLGGNVIDNAGNQAQAGVDHTQFSSVVHNFVRQMLLGLKAQTAADQAIAHLKANEKPLIALENTMGSFLAEYAGNHNIHVGEPLGDFTYRTVLTRALERTRYVTIVDAQGNKTKQHITLEQLDPVTRQAYDTAQGIIDDLEISIPVSPIDWMRQQIVNAGYTVAEITGRDYAVDYSNPLKPKLTQVDHAEQNDKVRTTRNFNSGKLDALILNVSGSTGISLHASEKFSDQRPRRMIVAQAAQDINILMQMLGRVHRTGQVNLPGYKMLTVDLPAERRPAALTSKKMKSLNANTSSNTESATSVDAVDMMNKYGDQVVAHYLGDNPQLALTLGFPSPVDSDGHPSAPDMARKVTGRIALMPVALQKTFYEEVEGQYTALIDYLNQTNQNDLEPKTFDFQAVEQKSEVIFEGTNQKSPFGADANYGEYSVRALGKAMTPEEIQADIDEHLNGKRGIDHADAIVAALGAQYRAYRTGLADDQHAAADSQVERASMFIRQHAIGSLYRVDINGDQYNAVVTNIRSTHKTNGNPFAMSKIQVTIAVNGALRHLTVPATQFEGIEVSGLSYRYSLDQLFKVQAEGRETAKIITGNLLGAYGELQGTRGTIISFTKEDGSSDLGILLPKQFTMADNARGGYRLRTGEQVIRFLHDSHAQNIGQLGVASRDGNVRIVPSGDRGITIRVPRSKSGGAKFFLDAGIRAITGDFVTIGDRMVATVPGARATAAIEAIMKKQAIYALPSMTSDAKAMFANDKPVFNQSAFRQEGFQGAKPADVGRLQQLGDAIAAKFARKVDVIAVSSVSSPAVPKPVRDEAKKLILAGGNIPSAVLYEGRVYLFADRISSDREAAESVLHEVYGHLGLRGNFGADLDAILKQIVQARAGEVAAIIRRNGFLPTDREPTRQEVVAARMRASEELLAEMSQTDPQLPFVKRAIAAIRTWLRANLPTLFGKLALTDDEIIRSFLMPARAFIETGARTAAPGAGPAFSQSRNVVGLKEARKYDFKTGEPVTIEALHGTSEGDIAKFNESERGLWFTDSPALADQYTMRRGLWRSDTGGGAIYPVRLSMENPLVIDALGTRYDNIPVPWQEWKPKVYGNLPKNAVNMQDALAYAKEHGHDGLIVRNVLDTAIHGDKTKATVYAVLETRQAESSIDGSAFNQSQKEGLTQTEAFKRWFGDSKVVDAKGQPLVVYHGTNKSFTEFNKRRIGKGIAAVKGGFFFSGSESSAADYAEDLADDKRGKPIVMATYLSITSPVKADARDANPDEFLDANIDHLMAQAKAEKADGIIVSGIDREGNKASTYLAFRPEQIKSATGNNGQFDPNAGNILFSRVGPNRREFIIGTAAALAASPSDAQTIMGRAKALPASVMGQRLPPAVEKLLVGNGHGTTNLEGSKAIREALSIIARTGPQEVRALAAEISKLLPAEGVSVQVDKGNWSAHGAVEMSPLVRLRLFDGSRSQGLTYDTFLHETLHVAVLARYRALSVGVVRSNDAKLGMAAPAAAKALEQFRAVWDEFRSEANTALRTVAKDADLHLSLQEAAGDPDEFFVRALTEPHLQAWMAQQEYKGKTLWERFKDWIKQGLFLWSKPTGTAPSWLDAALLASDDLLKAMAGDKPDFERLRAISRFNARASDRRSEIESPTVFAQRAIQDVWPQAQAVIREFSDTPGKLNWWHKTLGTPFDLAKRYPQTFGKVYDRVQEFLRDVSLYATEAANFAPTIIPNLESWRDIVPKALGGSGKKPLSPADNKTVGRPIWEGTLAWTRDDKGRPVKMTSVEAEAEAMDVHEKAQRLFKGGHVPENVLHMWRGLPMEQYEAIVAGSYEKHILQPGIVWTDAELKSMFGLDARQIGIYREFHAAGASSLNALSKSDMLRFAGKDAEGWIRQQVLDAPDAEKASELLRDHLLELAELMPERADVLTNAANVAIDKGNKIAALLKRGYAPLSRFGKYTVDVVDADGERVYFGLFEGRMDARHMAARMAEQFPGATIRRGTTSQEEYKMFAGMSPETAELFGEMLGLEADGTGAANIAFQKWIKNAKASRSAMKRLIERKGIAGYSEDMGRVLAGFVYSNSRQISQNLHASDIKDRVQDMPQGQGELKDAAIRLMQYVQEPQEEAHGLRGLLFAQYLGGSIAAMLVNMTQPFQMTMPYLSQYGGIRQSASMMKDALRDVWKASTGDAALDAALKKRVEDGTVAPQEVHQLMAQAAGTGALRAGDGTVGGNALATGSNALARLVLAWGKPFSMAELFNRRVTYIAAYRTAVKQGMADPDAFAADAVDATQGRYNKGNKPEWGRGPVGSVLLTFRQYSISYLELVHRMWTTGGPEGKKAAVFMLGMLMLMGGAGGLPFVEDVSDLIDGAGQRMGYNLRTRHARQQFLASVFGEAFGGFVDKGVSGLPGAPIDISGRFGMGNLIPGTGLLTKKADHTRDVTDIAGPAGDFASRVFQGANKALEGDVIKGGLTMAPKAASNLAKAAEMASLGFYTDASGKKVVDTDAYDAFAKAIGFQPNAVAKVQQATSDVQQLVAVARLKETEIANRWAMAVFQKDSAAAQSARDEVSTWNAANPESPIRIAYSQITKRVREMNKSKEQRVSDASPREVRATVKRELSESRK